VRWTHDEVVAVLHHFGFALHRHGARHDIYVHAERAGIVIVPRHRRIPDPTVRSIWRQAAISRSEAEGLK